MVNRNDDLGSKVSWYWVGIFSLYLFGCFVFVKGKCGRHIVTISINMATFTKIPDSETPVVSVNHLNKIAKINDNVYGGFTEYVVTIRISWKAHN